MKLQSTLSLILICIGAIGAHAETPAHSKAAVWPAKNISWTQMTVLTVREEIASLEKAKDVETFCPGYAAASSYHRELCWLRIVGGIAKYESSFKPNTQFMEADMYSVGLLSLSAGESQIAPTIELLKVPELNLRAGVQILADAIARDGWISGTQGKLGGASYWSVLRAPYKVGDFELGHREKIIQISSTYANF